MEEKVKSKGGSFCSVTVNCLPKSSLYHGNCHFIFSLSEVRNIQELSGQASTYCQTKYVDQRLFFIQ